MTDSDSSNSDDEMVLDVLFYLPRPRFFRDRSNPLEDFDDFDFKSRFRLSKETFVFLLHLIGNDLRRSTNRSFAISPEIQILVTLRYYATGMLKKFRKFKQVFFRLKGFPRVVGAVDCTHIRIQSPNSNIGERFRNRKGYFSFNVQAICDSNLKIMNIVARWPGSVHDSTIFDNSMCRAQFENGEYGNSFLLGDGGYPCRDYMMTPLLRPVTEAEKRYQKAHIGTRNVVERLFGVWKRRFPVIAVGIRTQLNTTMTTIVATAVLYNILKEQGDEMPADEYAVDNDLLLEIDMNPVRQTGNLVRGQLIDLVFT
ncbi:unnamed protein product [Macrosiphum euphorbiae]|uniref:Putative nuclease HARBI1 n=1 Tax=Macrosiphum euphorbiae TaxID=13131 RepID=A0AAV0VIG0_9HEMI|nr:unnamed protein product [Macrosiphum euphorbiae]